MRCPACTLESPGTPKFCPSCGVAMAAPQSAEEAPPQASLVGTTFAGKYRISKLLGEGGMGCVYVGEQTLGPTVRKVAIKTLHPHLAKEEAIRARFAREGATLAGLEHPNTVQVFDSGTNEDGSLFLVMELVQGESIASILDRDEVFEPARASAIVEQICGSLEEAHQKGIIHRDLKPDNIVLVRRGGESDFVKLVDFGIAQFAGPVAHRTRAGIALGSAAYMAPEQAEGKRVDGRADLYAVGVVMHELLTGEVPFLGKTSRETLEIMHATRVPSAGGNHGAGLVSDDFARLVQRCMAKRPEDRYQSADELRNALLDVAGLTPDRSDSTQVMTATRFSPKRALKAAGLWNSVFVPALTFALGILVGILILKWL